MIAVVTFCEGSFADARRFKTEPEAWAFADGVSFGAGQYGAGSCSAYVLPAADGLMRSDEDAAEVVTAMAAVARLSS